MENKRRRSALILTHLGGLTVLVVVLAGLLPFVYRAGIVYPGFGWYKAGILVIGLAALAFGLYKLKKSA